MAVSLRSADTAGLTQVQNLREQIERAERRRADTNVLPVPPALATLFFDGGLKPGSAYTVDHSLSLMISLMAAPSASGSWCAAVGFPSLSAEATEAFGIALDRLVLVPNPGDRWLSVTAALAEIIPVIAIRPPTKPRDAEVARLGARLRERGGVLLVLGEWPGSEATLSLSEASWQGLGSGYGALRSRAVTVSSSGRRSPVSRRTRVLLPGPSGALAAMPPTSMPSPSLPAPGRRAHLTAVSP